VRQAACSAFIALNQLLFHCHKASHVVLHLLQESRGFLHENVELVDLSVQNPLLLLRERRDVDSQRFLKPLKELA